MKKISNCIHISFVKLDFKCPVCSCEHKESDYYNKLEKAKYPVVYFKCKGCKTKLGLTIDMTGQVKVWEKSTEKH